MTHSHRKIFIEVEKRLSLNPATRLCDLVQYLECSHPTIEKAVKTHTDMSFRKFQQKKRLEAAAMLKKHDCMAFLIDAIHVNGDQQQWQHAGNNAC